MLDKPQPRRSEGPTPNGGAYALAYGFDAAGNPVELEQAETVEIHEHTDDGDVIHRTYMRREPKAKS